MLFPNTKVSGGRLPDGYGAIPVTVEQKDSPLKICVIVKLERDPAAGYLVVLRDTIDARILLGCVIDADEKVHHWIELWIQTLDGLAGTAAVSRRPLTNPMLDDRWIRQFHAFESLEAAGIIKTGWESAHPKPIFLDMAILEAIHPKGHGGDDYWQLCQDDALLREKGLAEYSKTLHRYLYQPTLKADSSFIPVTPDAPANEHTKDISEICREQDNIIALNPSGGFMLVRGRGTIGLEDHIDLLGGRSWEGIKHGRSKLDLGEAAGILKDVDAADTNGGRLFLDTHGVLGSLAETFHLKLCLLADLVWSVQTMTCNQQRPFFNLSPDSFQVKLGNLGRGLPVLWTAKVVLAEAGNVIAMPIQTSDTTYYLPAGDEGASVYRPVSASMPVQGHGTIRIRQVTLLGSSEKFVLEGTFTTHERIEAASNDLIGLRLNLASGRLDLYGRLETVGALASGEWRFRTIDQRLSEAQVSNLRATEGVTIPETWFELVPLLSSPYDLYSIGVLMVRTLLVNGQTTLPVVLDKMLSLARQADSEYDNSVSLDLRIKNIFDNDSRWGELLWPHRLTHEQVSHEDAFEIIPAKLWYATLAMIVRTFPGIGRDSECRNYGDATPGSIHKVFDRLMADLDGLVLLTRSLVVTDCKFNREINKIIEVHLRS